MGCGSWLLGVTSNSIPQTGLSIHPSVWAHVASSGKCNYYHLHVLVKYSVNHCHIISMSVQKPRIDMAALLPLPIQFHHAPVFRMQGRASAHRMLVYAFPQFLKQQTCIKHVCLCTHPPHAYTIMCRWFCV